MSVTRLTLPFLPLLLALPLVLLSLILHARWEGGIFSMPTIWAGLSVLALLAGSHAGARAAVTRFTLQYLSNPWLWLAVALLLAALGAHLGVWHHGARRQLGDVLLLHSGLWAAAAWLVFLSLYSQKPSPGLVRHTVAGLATVAMLVELLQQPDVFVVGLIGILAVFVALHARNAVRWVVPVGVIGAATVLVLNILTKPYLLQRLMSAFDAAHQDPLGRGWVAHVQTQAQALAAVFHGGGEPAADLLARLPADMAPYLSPAYIMQWGGWAALVSSAVLLLTLAWTFWQRAKGEAVNSSSRLLLCTGSLALVLTTSWTLAVYLNHWSLNVDLGLAFVNGQFGLVLALLGLLGDKRPPTPPENPREL